MRRLLLSLSVALTSVFLMSACGRGGWRSGREDRDEILSAHGAHIRAGINCLQCHTEATKLAHPLSTGGEGKRPLLPREARCKSCHDERPEQRECSYCHTRPDAPQTYAGRTTDLVFNHANHIERSGGLCMRCHASGQSSAQAFRPRHNPPMADCTRPCHSDVENHDIHARDMEALNCTRCHDDLHSYQISQLRVVRHRPGFMRRHGPAARADRELCGQCHDASFCSDCHSASPGLPPDLMSPTSVYRDFVHRGDFVSRHTVEARVSQETCTRCHGVSFCDGCHRESGVGGSVAAGSPHAPGWLDPLSSRNHARAARRDILACAACHESNAETLCVSCHRVGGVARINPHPPRFGEGVDPLRHGVCRVCHVGGS